MKDNNTKFKQIIDKKSKKFNSRKMCKYYHKLDSTLNYETSYTQSILCKNVVYGAFMKVPLVRQAHNFTCGVACTMSVLRYLGYDFDTREDVLLKFLKSDPESGTNNNLIINFLNNVEYKAKDNGHLYHPISAEGRYFAALDELQSEVIKDNDKLSLTLLNNLRTELSSGHPVICVIQAWAENPEVYNDQSNNDNGHYVVAVGYGTYVANNSNKIFFIFMDPSTSGSYTYISEEEFLNRWHDKGEKGKEYNCFGIVVKYNDIKPSGDEKERLYPLG